MLTSIITSAARRQFSRALQFDENIAPGLPSCSDDMSRLMYVHIPFCEELCPYCSFHRITFNEELAKRYFAALSREILLYKEKGYKFSGIYVGGGTPTVLIGELSDLLLLAQKTFNIYSISVETNPHHLTPVNVGVLQNAGVKRLSVGVQTFNDEFLKKIGRYEKYGSGKTIAEKLQDVQGSFDTLNADMIFNFPGQTRALLNADIDVLLKLRMEQITFYPLMVSALTRRLMAQTMGEVNFRREKKLYKAILNRLEQNYDSSSAWCFSRKKNGKNLIDEYVVDFDEYAGLGSGAIGYLQGMCYANTFNIDGYIAALEQNRLPIMASRKFDQRDRLRYDFLMKLFSTKINVDAMEEKYAGKFLKALWKETAAFILAGSFRYFPPNLILTRRGRYFWVVMMREFFTAVNNFRDYCRQRTGIT